MKEGYFHAGRAFSNVWTIARASLLLVGLGVLASCATFHLEPLSLHNVQVTQYRSNKVAQVSEADLMNLTVTPDSSDQNLTQFWVTIENRSDMVMHISDSDFTLFNGPSIGDWHSLGFYPSAEYVKKVRNGYIASAILTGISGALESANAGHHTEYESGNFGGSANGGYYHGYYSGYRTYYDPAEAAAVRAQNAAEMDQLVRSGRDQVQFLQNNLFYSVDLPAGKAYTGLVVGPKGDDGFYDFVLSLQGNRFEIVFQKVKNQ